MKRTATISARDRILAAAFAGNDDRRAQQLLRSALPDPLPPAVLTAWRDDRIEELVQGLRSEFGLALWTAARLLADAGARRESGAGLAGLGLDPLTESLSAEIDALLAALPSSAHRNRWPTAKTIQRAVIARNPVDIFRQELSTNKIVA